MNIIEWLLIIIFGIPLLVVMVIPFLAYWGAKAKLAPSFTSLVQYFNVDIGKDPYKKWYDKSPILFIGLTSIELYVSWYLIKVVNIIKKIVLAIWWIINNTIGRYVKWQWRKWDRDFEEQEKKQLGIQAETENPKEKKKEWFE